MSRLAGPFQDFWPWQRSSGAKLNFVLWRRSSLLHTICRQLINVATRVIDSPTYTERYAAAVSSVPIKRGLRMPARHKERHRAGRVGWLRAAVLGANDGIVSTASLVLGVAAAHGTPTNVLIAGVAGLVSGAMAMAAGEYVSVHSQADTEQAELQRCLERATTELRRARRSVWER
jgi:VIT family